MRPPKTTRSNASALRFDADEAEAVRAEAEAEVERAVRFARDSGYPPDDLTVQMVYA